MRRTRMLVLAGVGVLLSVTVGAATAGEPERTVQATLRADQPAGFEIEIDPELDARFGPRVVNAVQAAGIFTAARPGALVVKVELEEEGGRAFWEVEAQLAGGKVEALVDAFTGGLVVEGSGDSPAGGGRAEERDDD